jgi:hypothetical protein
VSSLPTTSNAKQRKHLAVLVGEHSDISYSPSIVVTSFGYAKITHSACSPGPDVPPLTSHIPQTSAYIPLDGTSCLWKNMSSIRGFQALYCGEPGTRHDCVHSLGISSVSAHVDQQVYGQLTCASGCRWDGSRGTMWLMEDSGWK